MILLRVLWGNDDVKLSRWRKARKKIQFRSRYRQPEQQYVYVYGKKNADLLVSLKYPNVFLVDDSPWPDGKYDRMGDCPEAPKIRPWHYKFELILKALGEHDKVLYCDWDVSYVKQDWVHVEDRLSDKEMYLTGYFYRKGRHPERSDTWGQHFSVSGSWLYFSNPAFPRQVLENMKRPGDMNWLDEWVMGYLLDKKHGGWKGDAHWLENYESPLVHIRTRRCPWKVKLDDGYFVTRHTPIDFTWEKMFITT